LYHAYKLEHNKFATYQAAKWVHWCSSPNIWHLFVKSAWSNYIWPTGHFTKMWQLAGHFWSDGV